MRPNVLAHPSPTTGRFLLLIGTLLSVGLLAEISSTTASWPDPGPPPSGRARRRGCRRAQPFGPGRPGRAQRHRGGLPRARANGPGPGSVSAEPGSCCVLGLAVVAWSPGAAPPVSPAASRTAAGGRGTSGSVNWPACTECAGHRACCSARPPNATRSCSACPAATTSCYRPRSRCAGDRKRGLRARGAPRARAHSSARCPVRLARDRGVDRRDPRPRRPVVVSGGDRGLLAHGAYLWRALVVMASCGWCGSRRCVPGARRGPRRGPTGG